MPLAKHLWLLLLFSFVPIALAGPESLPFLSPYVSSIIPTCAQHCFEEFIVESFPTSVCPNQQDLYCLCTSKSRTGLTLGEGALQCLAQNCQDESELQLALAYEVCFGVPNAVSETHQVITATIKPSTTTTRSQSTTTTSTDYFFSTIPSIETIRSTTSSSTMSLPTSIITASGTPSLINPTSWVPTIQTSTTLTTQTRSPTSTVTASAATSSVVAAAAASGLSNAQISGIVVGSVAAGALAFGLLFFFTCYRMRRRRLRDSGSSFGGGEVVEARPTIPYHSDPVADLARRGPPPKAQRVLGFPGRHNENSGSSSRRTPPSPLSNNSLQLGFPKPPSAAYAGSHEHSPISAVSYRTTSRLLPDMPTYDIPSSFPRPYPARTRNPGIGGSYQSEDSYDATIPKPSPLRPHRNSQRLRPPTQGPSDFHFPAQPQNLADPFVDSSTDPRARLYALERRRAAKEALPRIITPPIHASNNNSWSPSRNPTFHPPPPVLNHGRHAHPPKQAHFNLQPVSRAISPSLRSYTSSDPRYSNFSQPSRDSQYPPRESSYQPYQPTQNIAPRPASHSRKSAGKRPLTHLTTASDTSFEESDIEDTNDAPLPESALSPVVESPLNVRAPPAQVNRSLDSNLSSRSPIANIRYPPIPGTAVSSYSRRQQTSSPPHSPTPKPQQRRPNPRLPLTVRTTGLTPQAVVRPGVPDDRSIDPRPTVRLVPPQTQQQQQQSRPAELSSSDDSIPPGAVRRPEHIISDAYPRLRPGGGNSDLETLKRTAKHRILLNQDIRPAR